MHVFFLISILAAHCTAHTGLAPLITGATLTTVTKSCSSSTTSIDISPQETEIVDPSLPVQLPAASPSCSSSTTSITAIAQHDTSPGISPPAGASTTITTSTPPESSPSEQPLPSFPLSLDAITGLDSLLNLITSIPDDIIDAGDEAVTGFYNNISACVSNKSGALKAAVSELSPALASLADNIEEEIAKGAEAVTSFLGFIITGAPDVATSVASAVRSEITEVPGIITSALAPIASGIKDLLPGLPIKRQNVLSSLGDIINEVDNLRGCLTAAKATNPIFGVADCAFNIASFAVPAARILKAKRAVQIAGRVRMVQALGNSRSAADVGKDVLDALKELSGITDLVKACKFLVE